MRKYPALALTSLLLVAACGGGSSSFTTPPPPPMSGPNVATLTVDSGPAGTVNEAFVSVTICQPGSTSNCQTITGIQVDTGSSGLRIISSVLNASLLAALPQQTVGGTTTPVVECAQFADGYTWGPVVSADVTIASEKASGIPIQVIGSPSFTQVPAACSSPVPNAENTVATLFANGLIGVGVFLQDCGSFCATNVVAGTYYQCPTNGGACASIVEPVNLQVANPVGAFAADNNGVIVELPSVPANGAATATGALVFGIGTASNNSLGSATPLATDPNTGTITVSFNGSTLSQSFLDSGSDAYIFTDSSLSACAANSVGSGFYCETTPANLSATIKTVAGMQLAANFTVGDATSMFQIMPLPTALPQLGAPLTAPAGSPLPPTFDFGLPFFYGRNVYTAIETRTAGGVTGPYFAY